MDTLRTSLTYPRNRLSGAVLKATGSQFKILFHHNLAVYVLHFLQWQDGGGGDGYLLIASLGLYSSHFSSSTDP